MDHIKVLIFVESRYKVNRKRIKAKTSEFLTKQEVNGPIEVSVAVVGDRKMRELSIKYKNEDKTCSVLAFSLAEGESSFLPKDILRLGDVVISYPQVIKEASEEEVLVDDKIDELIEHGMLHLLGINQE